MGIYKEGSESNITLIQENIPASDTWNNYLLISPELPSDTTGIKIRLLQSNNNPNITYVDNLNLSEI